MARIRLRFHKKEAIPLQFIVVFGLLLRLLAIITFHHTPESDELSYISMAFSLVHGDGVVDSYGNHAFYNVGYSLFTLAPVFYLFGENFFAARTVNALFGGLSIILCYGIAKEAGLGRFGRLFAAAMWAVYLPASVYVVYLDKENLMTPLILGVTWCALHLESAPRYGTAGICGVLFGALALTGNAGICLAPLVILVIFVFTPATLAKKICLSSLVLTSAGLITLPWVIRNAAVVGAPVLNTNGGFNLYLGNNPNATGMFVSIADTPRGSTWHRLLRDEGELRASETLKQDAIRWITTHPYEFVMLSLKKAAYFWLPPFHDGKYPESRAERAARIMWAAQFIVLLAGTIATLVARGLLNRQMAVLWLILASFTSVHMLFYVVFRYRLPIMPILCVMTGATVEAVYTQWLSSRMRRR
jgi:4-amino-4-deoxy-L-arabinose transferase-like glycosyltransferase